MRHPLHNHYKPEKILDSSNNSNSIFFNLVLTIPPTPKTEFQTKCSWQFVIWNSDHPISTFNRSIAGNQSNGDERGQSTQKIFTKEQKIEKKYFLKNVFNLSPIRYVLTSCQLNASLGLMRRQPGLYLIHPPQAQPTPW